MKSQEVDCITVSIHALLAECDRARYHVDSDYRVSIHALLAECDGSRPGCGPCQKVSIHALLAECDSLSCLSPWPQGSFNPRTPCGVRPDAGRVGGHHQKVSIHALLAECDTFIANAAKHLNGFNPRTPCGVRRGIRQSLPLYPQFQSTHSLRSATLAGYRFTPYLAVSIHALLAECDRLTSLTTNKGGVSIHALLAECDRKWWNATAATPGFNPRTPCGVRPARRCTHAGRTQFQSTHSLRSATGAGPPKAGKFSFQSTHSLRSATFLVMIFLIPSMSFNPRTPCGVRLENSRLRLPIKPVSIHALLAECDKLRVRFLLFLLMFQSTHSLRSATPLFSPSS